MYQAGLKYILGVRPEYNGLRVDPCIPAEWNSFRVWRRFRGALYEIKVTNPEHVCKGIRTIQVDGELLSGAVLPIFEDGGTHTIAVVLG
jgi:cellobiose phosphorylase